MKTIEARNLTKFYGKHRGIADLSLCVDEGEIFGFVGPNGAGKSTTIRTLLNYIYPTNGTGTILGMDIVKDSTKIKKYVGYLPSEVIYYHGMKVKDLLLYSASFYQKDCTSRMLALSERLELNINRKIEDLSFGNRKKVGIVQAFQHEPQLLILDEPTSGLDPLMQKEFYEIVIEARKMGATVFFSSHILNEVQRLCDKVGIISRGKLIKVETIEALMKTSLKKITITGGDLNHLPLEEDSVIKTEKLGKTVKILYKGKIKQLMDALNPQQIENLLIEEPSLEEVFMLYYINPEKGGGLHGVV